MLSIILALFAKLAPKAVNATVIGIYYMAFFVGNSLVGWIGGWYETMPTASFWLLHAGFALVFGLCFIPFKLFTGWILAGDGLDEMTAEFG